MKKPLYLFAILLLAACSKFSGVEDDPMVVRFNLVYPSQTKASATAFESGDVTGIYMTENSNGIASPLQVSGNAVNNAAITFDGTSWTSNPKLFWDKGVKYDVYGYYPYGKPASVDDYSFSVAADQSTKEEDGTLGGYEASDFLWAKTEGVTYPDVVNLTFSHKMSRLVVKLVKGSDFEGDIPDDVVVKVHSTVPDALIDLSSGAVVKDNYGSATTITMQKEGTSTFAAIVVPQRIENKQPLVEIITNNVSYLVESRFVFKSGVQHTISITLASDPAKVKIDIGGEINGWN
jgi:hypothetical protein